MRTTLFIAAIFGALAFSQIAHSQAPIAPQGAAQKLQAIRAKNKELIDHQTETLKKLDDLQLESQQLKFLGKRA